MARRFGRTKSIYQIISNWVYRTPTPEEKTTDGGPSTDPSCSNSIRSGEMPRDGKSKPSKKSSEFNHTDYAGLSWDTLIGDSAPPLQEQQSSATSKQGTVSPRGVPSFLSTTSQMVYGVPAWEWELLSFNEKVLTIQKALRSTTTTRDAVIPPASNGQTGIKKDLSDMLRRLNDAS